MELSRQQQHNDNRQQCLIPTPGGRHARPHRSHVKSDSDDLNDLKMLRTHVKDAGCLLLLQTKGVLARPWCLFELVAAIEERVPIVGVTIVSGTSPYDFSEASRLLVHLDTLLPSNQAEALTALGIDLLDAAYKLSNTLPAIISVALNMNESRGRLRATLDDVVEAMEKARPSELPDRDEWLASRGSPAPVHGLGSTAAVADAAASSTRFSPLPPSPRHPASLPALPSPPPPRSMMPASARPPPRGSASCA